MLHSRDSVPQKPKSPPLLSLSEAMPPPHLTLPAAGAVAKPSSRTAAVAVRHLDVASLPVKAAKEGGGFGGCAGVGGGGRGGGGGGSCGGVLVIVRASCWPGTEVTAREGTEARRRKELRA